MSHSRITQYIHVTGAAEPLKLKNPDLRFYPISEQAIDAGIAAWFGVTKVQPESPILRERMKAAYRAMIAEIHGCGHLCREDSTLGFIPEAGCPVHDVPPPAAPPAVAASSLCYSTDGEGFRYDDLSEVLSALDDEGNLIEGATFHEGEAISKPASYYFSIDALLENMAAAADDEGGEHADGFPDLDASKIAELEAHIKAWLNANVTVNFWTVRNTREVAVTQQMIEEHQA